MARGITADQWADARAMRESGKSYQDIADAIGCSAVLVHRKSKDEGWGDGSDLEEVIRAKALAKVNKIVNAVDPEKMAESIAAAADQVAEVITRHRTDLTGISAAALDALDAGDEKRAKIIKITAETLKIVQDCERRAWGIEPEPKAAQTTVNIESDRINSAGAALIDAEKHGKKYGVDK